MSMLFVYNILLNLEHGQDIIIIMVKKGYHYDSPTARNGVVFMIQYKIDVLSKLKEAGYTTYKIRQEKILHEMSLQALRSGKLVSWGVMDTLCHLLKCQPGDLVQHIDEPFTNIHDK